MGLILLLSLLQDSTLSGPQKGEKLKPFKVVDVNGPHAGKEVDYVAEFGAAPTLIVFIHELTRPAAQCFRPLDEYAAKNPALRALFVVLTENQDGEERHLPAVVQSLKMKSILSVSVDGKEGPGAYGLNKKVTLTVLVAKDGAVTANFAILSPNETDAPKILAALDPLLAPKLDTMEEMRAEILRLREEIRRLREEIDALKKPKREDDPKLTTMFRRLIRPDNPEADVDAALKEIEEYARDAKVRTRVLELLGIALQQKYGTEYARKKMEDLKSRLEK